MIKNLTGTVHNRGFMYNIDIDVKDGYITHICGNFPKNILAEIEKQRIKYDTNDIIALPNVDKGWTFFNMAEQRVAFTDNAQLLAVEVNGKYEI